MAAASAVAAVGVVRLAVADDPLTASDQVTVDSLTVRVARAERTAMDHDMSSGATGYQMPPAMMPGMPEDGDQRLAISVAVTNTSAGTRLLRPGEEFALRAGEGDKRWEPRSDTFGDLPRLAPHNAVTGILYFDLPIVELDDSLIWLEWTHDGTTSRLTIPVEGASAPPSHSHNP